MHKLIFTRALHADAVALLAARKDTEAVFLSEDFRGPPMPRELAAQLPDAFGAMIGLERIADDLLATAPSLRMISRFGAGGADRCRRAS
jgi:phosphoglycerate dehydrogenase-like enzyme